MPVRVVLIAGVISALLFAAPPTRAADGYFDVGKLPLPPLTGAQIASDIETFTTDYAPRVTGTAGEQEAGEFLRAEMESLGYKAETILLPVAGGDPSGTLRAIVATKQGTTKPGEYILMMGHYDTVAGFGGATVNGSYDNGSGTTMIRSLAKSFAKIPTNRSLAFIFYNGEEEGVLASDRHAAMWEAEGKPVRAALGFDMTGIAYPVASPTDRSCLCIWYGDEDEGMEGVLRHVNYGALGFPEAENLVYIVGVNERNSDESSWDKLGYKTLRWAGMRAASDYPAYHMPDDNMATIDEVAGGRTYFEQGLRNTLNSAYLTALAVDNEMPVARATATGQRPVMFDATASSDPDGAVGEVTWDFGDGVSATGASVTHAYAKGGVYVATATVRDNLWPQVTASVPVAVTVPDPPVAKKPAAKKKKKKCARKKGKRAKKRCKRKRSRH